MSTSKSIKTKMKFILASTPMTGHANPMLNAGRILREAGHKVVFSSSEAFQKQAETFGIRFVPLPAGANVDFTDPNAGRPERESIPLGPARALFDFRTAFADPIMRQFEGLQSLLKTFSADAILVDTTFGGVIPFLLGNYPDRPLIASLGVVALPFQRADGAPFGPALPPVDPASERAAEYRAMAEEGDALIATPMRRCVDEILEKLGARPLPMPYFDSIVALPDLYLQPGLEKFDLPHRNLPNTVHYIGALPPFSMGDMPADVQALVNKGKRIVVVTQGTVANRDLGELVLPAVQGLAMREDLTVIATTGGAPDSGLAFAIPENASVVRYLPLDELLRYADVLITNGGYGTATTALSKGVPMIVAGAGADKAEVALRVAYAGSGIDMRTDRPEPDALRKAVDAILGDKEYLARAREIAAKFTQIDTSQTLVRLLEEAVLKHREVPVQA
jgi:MGT family glycosyltransferase